ncbi:MAG: 4-alpha-glucanotransferase [Polyangiaceae bacterium]|nr:4-alpha-glucanotransferase [Polyangiaceae bacterium]
MKGRRLDQRSAGLLVHPTSLTGAYESGDLGPSARRFVDFLASAKVAWWQMLPLGPAGHGGSPYSSTSVFAGNPNLVSIESLVEDGLLDASDPSALPAPNRGDKADLVEGEARRGRALSVAFERAKAQPDVMRALAQFAEQQAYWLDDYALFAALKRAHGGVAYSAWPEPLRTRKPAELQAFASDRADAVLFEKFVQYRFAKDLDALVRHARDKNVSLMGDAPIYVAHDSADVWAHPEIFQLDASGEPTHVAGVPPDAFSDDGQLWGNPLYDWEHLERTGFGFWIARLARLFETFDAVRLDHFIGFSRYWAVARGAKSAKEGTFHDVPGKALFDAVFRSLGPVQLIAEDLGVVTDAVRALRDHFRLPGMSVLLFSFSPGAHAEGSRAHRFATNSIVYTGTHDNDTTAGWFSGPPDNASASSRAHWQAEQGFAREYLDVPNDASPEACARALLIAALRNHATTAVVPVQDLLGQGRHARMNRPGIAEGNWTYRLKDGDLTDEVAASLARKVEIYGRG